MLSKGERPSYSEQVLKKYTTERRSKSIAEKRKTTTSTKVKRRWNEANYTRITVYLQKAQAEEYKAKCDKLGISLSEIPKEAISQFLREN